MAQTKNDKTQQKFDNNGRRLLTASFSGQKEMLACGWTQEQIDALVNAPRTKADVEDPTQWVAIEGDKYGNVTAPANAEWHWPQVDGYAVCGTSLLTEAEKARYRAYIKQREENRGGAPKAVSQKKPADMDKWLALREAVKDNPTALALVEELMPRQKAVSAYKKLTGRDSVDDTCWTMFGLMYAGLNGEKEPRLMADNIGEKLEQGWMPVFRKADVDGLIQKCKESGMTVTVNANGYTFSC